MPVLNSRFNYSLRRNQRLPHMPGTPDIPLFKNCHRLSDLWWTGYGRTSLSAPTPNWLEWLPQTPPWFAAWALRLGSDLVKRFCSSSRCDDKREKTITTCHVRVRKTACHKDGYRYIIILSKKQWYSNKEECKHQSQSFA